MLSDGRRAIRRLYVMQRGLVVRRFRLHDRIPELTSLRRRELLTATNPLHSLLQFVLAPKALAFDASSHRELHPAEGARFLAAVVALACLEAAPFVRTMFYDATLQQWSQLVQWCTFARNHLRFVVDCTMLAWLSIARLECGTHASIESTTQLMVATLAAACLCYLPSGLATAGTWISRLPVVSAVAFRCDSLTAHSSPVDHWAARHNQKWLPSISWATSRPAVLGCAICKSSATCCSNDLMVCDGGCGDGRLRACDMHIE
jgi:hypothetical protein